MIDDLFAEQQDSSHLFNGLYPQRPHPCGKGHIISVPDGELVYAPHFFSQKIADRALFLLQENAQYPQQTQWQDIDTRGVQWKNINWRQDSISMFGKSTPLPRLSAWYGDSDKPYTYSGLTLEPNTWNPMLNWLRDQLECLTQIRFNSVLLNWYRSGCDHISWHTDDEPELGSDPIIASVNFGATRRFLLRRNDDHATKIELPLGHGSLLIMQGALQHHWQHSIPKEKRVTNGRINMTFRVIHPGATSTASR